jgi:FolB domain-containing protein
MSLLNLQLSPDLDWIHLSQFELTCIVGILEKERIEAQRLLVEVGVGLDPKDLEICGETGQLDHSINYADIYHQIKFLAHYGKFRLIESFGVVLLRCLLLKKDSKEERADLISAYCRFQKPDILPSAISGVSMIRHYTWTENVKSVVVHEKLRYELLLSVEECSVYRIFVKQGGIWENQPVPRDGRVMVISGEFQSLTHPLLKRGDESSQSLEALTDGCLLCISSRPFYET